NAEPCRERRTIESPALARELLHVAKDADLAPGEAHAAQPERCLVERRRAHCRAGIRLRAPLRRLSPRADRARKGRRLTIAFRRAPEPGCDVRQVVGETLAAARADVAHQVSNARCPTAAHDRLAEVRGVDGGADRPVIHAAGLELARRVVEHADRGPGIAALTADDRAHEVAELLVLGKALGGTAEDELGDLRLTAQERDVPVIL